MPDIFKALASIGAWVLFIMGLFSFLMACVFWAGEGIDLGTTKIWCAGTSMAVVGMVMVTLSVCIMTLRRKME